MADIPKFGYPRRIDIVDAVNELGGAVEAALAEGGGGGGGGSCTLPVAGDSTLGGVKGQRVAEKGGNGRLLNVTPDGTAFIDAADALNPGVVRSKDGSAFADTDSNVGVNAHGYMKCDAPKSYVDAKVAGVEAHLEALEAESVTDASGTAPITLALSPADGTGNKVTASLKVGNGLFTNPSTGMLEVPIDTTAGLGYGSNGIEVEVDGTTIAHNASGRLHVVDSDAETVAVSEQLAPGTMSALVYGKTVCIEFGGVNVAENVKTKVGSVAAKYAPRTAKTGTLVAAAGNEMLSAYCKVETDGSIYINPVITSSAGYTWVGTFTYLI